MVSKWWFRAYDILQSLPTERSYVWTKHSLALQNYFKSLRYHVLIYYQMYYTVFPITQSAWPVAYYNPYLMTAIGTSNSITKWHGHKMKCHVSILTYRSWQLQLLSESSSVIKHDVIWLWLATFYRLPYWLCQKPALKFSNNSHITIRCYNGHNFGDQL